jgi:hypothetical protein
MKSIDGEEAYPHLVEKTHPQRLRAMWIGGHGLQVGREFGILGSSVIHRSHRSTVLLTMLCLALVPNGTPAQPASSSAPEIRFICFGPSPYTQRHDSLRAGLGILLSLRRVIAEDQLALSTKFYDGMDAVGDPGKGRKLLRGARVLVLGGPTWAQGSPYYIRRYFELVDGEYLGGVSATAWATAGGSHTGGEVFVLDVLRSLMGMGAQVFTMGQKLTVFTTDERLGVPPGDFTLLDCWYMDQFARTLALTALAGDDPGRAAELARKLHISATYYSAFPQSDAGLAQRYGALQKKLNAAKIASTAEYRELMALMTSY